MPSGQMRNCALKSQKVKWPRTGKRGYTRKRPTGAVLDAIFKDWEKGELSPEVEGAIGRQYPDYWELSSLVHCRACENLNTCKQRPHPFVHDLGWYFSQHGLIWGALSPQVRRAVLVLALLGAGGMRGGGYLRSDIGRIAGTTKKTSHSPTERVADRLCELHVLRKVRKSGRTRYEYAAPSYWRKVGQGRVSDRQSDWDHRTLWEEPHRNYFRKHARAVSSSMNHLVERSTGRVTPKGWDVKEVPMGMLVGQQPPEWYQDILKEYLSMFVDMMDIPLKGVGSEPELSGGWPSGEEAFRRLFERKASDLMKLIRAIPAGEEDRWNPNWAFQNCLLVLNLPGRDWVRPESAAITEYLARRGT